MKFKTGTLHANILDYAPHQGQIFLILTSADVSVVTILVRTSFIVPFNIIEHSLKFPVNSLVKRLSGL
jgi:hypothetical protein